MVSRVVVVSGSAKGTVARLTGSQFSVGRDSANHLCLHDLTVSRRHFTVSETDAAFHLVDLDSQNGTFVNGIPVRRKLLSHGDNIRVGQSELVFLIGEDEELAPRATAPPEEASQEFLTTTTEGPAAPSPGTDIGRMARDLNALFKIANTINSIRDLELLQEQLLRLICEVVPADCGAIVLTRSGDDEPNTGCDWSRKPGDSARLTIRKDLVQRTLWERAVTLSKASSETKSPETVLCVPLIGVESTIGVIYLASFGPEQGFATDHVSFLTSVAGIAAVTLENVLALEALRSENRRLKTELNLDGVLIGESKSMRQVQAFIARVAGSDSTVLIRGESGTGKELVARAIHSSSSRAEKPFLAINCAAIPEALLETELFGHEKGAFTGAIVTKKGKLEVAEEGTVFLDEVGELAPRLQAKLLRVLQEREFERLGGTRTIKFEARVLTATNRDLEEAIKEREFRADLYYRLNVVSVTIPPLRERPDDIALLAIYFAAKHADKCKRTFKGISPEARALLINYSWPGNVRELENAIEHAIVLGLGDEIVPDDLPEPLREVQPAVATQTRYHDRINQLKKQMIVDAVAECNGNYTEAARLLGVHPNYLHRLIRNLDIKSEIKAN